MSTALTTTDGLHEPAPARAAGVDRLRLLDELAAFALGFSLQFNVILFTFGLPFMRLSDAVPFALIPYFCLRTNFLARAWEHSTRIAIVLVLLMASVVLKSDAGPGDVYMTLILMVYFVQALQIVFLFGDRLLLALCAGILAGALGSLIVLIATGSGVSLEGYGLAVPTDGLSTEAVLFREDKLGGLWSDGNQTGHILAAAGAAAFCLAMHARSKIIYILYFSGLVASFTLTNNRAGLIVPLVALVFIAYRGIRLWQVLTAAIMIGSFLLYAGVTGTFPLPQALSSTLEKRLYQESNADNNIYERLDSSIEAVGLVLRHPFGIGNIAMENELQALTGVPTPHNGIIALAQQCGLLLAVLYAMSLVQVFIGRSQQYGRFIYATVLFSTLSMFFEQLTTAQYFLFLIALVLAAWTARGAHVGSLKP